jgi:ABC-type multidrug transport system fused ATPase/permease subunit
MPAPGGTFKSDLADLLVFRGYFRRFLPQALLVLLLAYVYADLNATAIGGLQQITSQLPEILSGERGPAGAPAGLMHQTVTGQLLATLGLSTLEHWRVLLAILVLLFLVASSLQLARDLLRARVSIRLKKALRQDVLDALYREPGAERINRSSGASAEFLRGDVDGTASVTVFGALGVIEALVLFTFFAWSLATGVTGGPFILMAFVLLTAAAQFVSASLTRRQERAAFDSFSQAQTQAASTTTRFFEILRDLLYLGGERSKGNQVVESWTRAEEKNIAIRVWTGTRSMIGDAFQHLNLPLIVFVVLETGGQAGAIVAALALIGQLSMPFAQLVSFPQLLVQFGPGLRSLARLLAIPKVGQEPPAVEELANRASPPALSVEGLTFSYPGVTTNVFEGVSIEIPAGAKVGIVGDSGCGKTSLARVLSGDWQPSRGVIRVGGVDVTAWPLAWRRKLIALSTENPGMLLDTLRENITFGRDCSGDQLTQALRASASNEVAEALPNGLDTMIAAEGQLSGGQRRRIALARALCGRQRVLVLDEPLAQLNPVKMREVATGLIEACAGRTCLIITHDMDLIDTDFNVFMEKGRVAAVGKHGDLVRDVPAYRAFTERVVSSRIPGGIADA